MDLAIACLFWLAGKCQRLRWLVNIHIFRAAATDAIQEKSAYYVPLKISANADCALRKRCIRS
jgi:hypothetical protein